MIEVGTRKRQNYLSNEPPQGTMAKTLTRDPGMSKSVTASMTFVSASAQVQAANGTFAPFAVNDVLLFEGVRLNDGYHTVVGIDTANHSYLILSPPPANEGPIAATVRTS